jgi:hypothetical protein
MSLTGCSRKPGIPWKGLRIIRKKLVAVTALGTNVAPEERS